MVLNNKKSIAFSLMVLCSLVFHSDLFSFADQTTSERILKENKGFVEFINIPLTNFRDMKNEEFKKIYEQYFQDLNLRSIEKGETENNDYRQDSDYTSGDIKKAFFKMVYGLHFNADIAYLQGDYKRTYHRIYSSQEAMSRLYEGMIYYVYLEDSKMILDEIAPLVIKAKNSRARLYLTLGYRDRTVSWNYYTIGEASNPRLYSYKIFQYEEGIKMARRAKRYGFLALYEAQKPEAKRLIFNNLIKAEKEAGNLFFTRFIDLKDEDYIKEMNRTYEEHEKTLNDSSQKEADSKDGKKEAVSFESIVEQRVRFKNEQRAAKLLLNHDFDQAEDIIRKYVDDYNYKIIISLFNQLTSSDKGDGDDKTVDYTRFLIHHQDNYSKTKEGAVTLIEEVIDGVKVEDKVKKPDSEKSGEEKGVIKINE